MSCKQRKRLRSVIHARYKASGNIYGAVSDTFTKKQARLLDNVKTRVCKNAHCRDTVQNVGEVRFADKYNHHTMYSEATKKTYHPAPRPLGCKLGTSLNIWQARPDVRNDVAGQFEQNGKVCKFSSFQTWGDYRKANIKT